MIKIQLTYHLYHSWKTEKDTSVIGTAFNNNELLKETALLHNFQTITNEESFKEKLQQLDGHFSIVTETETSVFIAVDTIRTFPLFIYSTAADILITDTIEPIYFTNETIDVKEVENFCKVYCTLENKTLLKGWLQLQAGEYAVIDKQTAALTIKPYFRHQSALSTLSKEALSKQLQQQEKKLIEKAIQYADNRPILIPLSGGYDSRYLIALLKEYNYPLVECYTYGRKDSFEVLIAKNVCEKLHIKWHFIEYTDTLLQTFFTEKWNTYAALNHHYSSLPHEQDFFALHYLKENNLLQENTVVMNGFCQDIHAGSFIEPVRNFDIQNFVGYKHQLKPELAAYENSWNGYQEWLIKNRLSKFIINSVRVYEYFGLDFYLPFWNTNWIQFWYALPVEMRLNQQYYNEYLLNGHFKKYHIDFKKPAAANSGKLYTLKKMGKTILPERLTKLFQLQNNKDVSKDVNNTLFLYEEIYKRLKEKPADKDFRINNIHALYLMQNLKEKSQL